VPRYTVKQGDCISSIAYDHGFLPDTIWNLPENSSLKSQRKDPNILFPGDQVFIPEKQLRIEPRTTDAKHQFVRKGVPEFLSLRFLNEDDPRKGESYILQVDGKSVSGNLDADGACVLALLGRLDGSTKCRCAASSPSHSPKVPA
jgi:hypothetical protein